MKRKVNRCCHWYRHLSPGNKIAVWALTVTVLFGVLGAVIGLRQTSIAEESLQLAREQSRFSDAKLKSVNDGTLTPLGDTNVCDLAGSPKNKTDETLKATGASSSGKRRRMVQCVSDVITVREGVVISDYALPQPRTNAMLRWSDSPTVTGEVFNLHYTVELQTLIDRAVREWRMKSYSCAVETAQRGWRTYESLLSEANGRPMKLDVGLIRGVLRLIPVLMDKAMADADYDGMEQLANQYDEFCIEPTMYARAMRDIARVKRRGGLLVFFSANQLRTMRNLGHDRLREYINMLATRGFLHPIELDASRCGYHAFSFERFFGFAGGITFLNSFQVAAKEENGTVVESNRVTGQWGGLGRIVSVDLDEAVALELGLAEEQHAYHPLKLDITFNELPWENVPNGRVSFSRVERRKSPNELLSEIIVDEDMPPHSEQ